MALLTVKSLTKFFGEEELLHDLSFEVYENNRIGLIGSNGSGKTTLFRIILGLEPFDSGEIVRAKNAEIGYMEQHVCSDFGKTAYEEVLTVFSDLIALEHRIEKTQQELLNASGDLSGLLERQMAEREEFIEKGGLTFRSRAKSALLGLGFTESSIENRVGVLSGGQKAKLQLAKLLLSGANLLLLDEPTNHLDLRAVEWLEGFLSSYKGAYLVISHDRYFLDRVTERTFSLHNRKLSAYKGNYSVYIKLKEQEDLTARRKYESTMREIRRIEGIIEQQRRWNQERNYRTIESKQKAIDRLEATLEKPEAAAKQMNFGFTASRRAGDDVFSCEEIGLAFGANRLFSNVNMEIKRGEHVFLIGENGCGKTSFLKTILGEYTHNEGKFRFGVGVELGYYDQIQSNLHDEKTVIDEIWDEHLQMNLTQVRSALALFLFFGEDVYKNVGTLSGGERARILLLKLMLSRANFLILDEPTNHLDILACEALEKALAEYEGTLLIVSHDRYLMNRLADKIYLLTKDGAELSPGNYDDFLQMREKAAQLPQKEPQPQSENKIRRETEARLKNANKELARIERQIEALENEEKELQEQLKQPEIAEDYLKVIELTETLERLGRESEERMLEWTQAAGELEALRAQIETNGI